MGQVSLFDDFEGFGAGDIEDLVEETKPKKKENKKKEGKNSKAKSKAKEEKLMLPVTVTGNSVDLSFSESDFGKPEVTLSDLMKKVKGIYPYADICELKNGKKGVLLCVKSNLTAVAPETPIPFDSLLPVTVAFGIISAQYYSEDFEGKDVITAFDVLKKFESENFQSNFFENASIYWDPKQNLVIPFFKANDFAGLDQMISLPVKVGFFDGNEYTYTKENFEGADKVSLKRLLSECEGSDLGDDAEMNYICAPNRILPVLCSKSKSSSAKVEVEYVDLPCTLAFTFKPERIELISDMFDGKETIRILDVQKMVESMYKIFTADNTEVYYVKEDNLVVVNRKSSTKGAFDKKVVSDLMSAREYVKTAAFPICYIEMENLLFRYEKAGIGEFIVPVNKKFQVLTGANMTLTLSLPKIPRRFLEETVRMFKASPEKEMAVQIWYNKEEYKLVVPEVLGANKVSITTVYDTCLFKKGFFVVCDIHSHNTMPAFFSSVDNADEIGTQLYGVIGNVDHDDVSVKFRVGCEGCFKELTVDEIFL